jgi:heptose I phosphotransferase
LDSLEQIIQRKLPDLITLQQKRHCRDKTLKLESDLLSYWPQNDVFAAIMQTSGVVYRAIESRKTLKFTHNNKNYFIKLHFGSGWFEIFKNLLFGRLPIIGAKNEYMALNQLRILGIKAPVIAGYGEFGCNPARQQSFLITHEVAHTVSLDTLVTQWHDNQLSWKVKQQLIKKIAYITATLHHNGINHRDLYACHFMINEPITNHPDITLMDLHRAQIRKKTPIRWVVKDLASLYYSILSFKLTKRDLLRFIQHYSAQSWQIEISKNEVFWQAVQQRSKSFIKRHHKFFATPVKVV